MPTKNGYYSDGYYKNDAGPFRVNGNGFVMPQGTMVGGATASTVPYGLARGLDDLLMRNYNNPYNDRAPLLFTGVTPSAGFSSNIYATPATFVFGSGKHYTNGALTNGYGAEFCAHYFFKNGVPFKGVYNPGYPAEDSWAVHGAPQHATNFVGGLPVAGKDANGFQYGNNGRRVTGVFNNRFYDEGTPASGVWEGVLYKGSKPFTGTNVIWDDITALNPTQVNALYPQFSYTVALANCVYTWPGFISGSQPEGPWGGLNGYISNPFVQPSSNTYYFNGTVPTGVINGKMYNEGILVTGDQILNDVLYRNGSGFSGKLNVPSNKTATFAGTSFAVPTSGVVEFAAGQVAHGFVGGKFYDRGVQIKSTQTYTLQLSSGVVANGVIGGVTYKNGTVNY